MRVKKAGIFLSVLAAAVFCGVILGKYFFDSLDFLSVLIAFVLIVVGAFIMAGAHILVHELGHLVGGFFGGFEFSTFTVGIFRIEKLNGKLKFSVIKQNEYGGICQMIPKRTKDVEKGMKSFVRGGVGGSVLFTGLSLLLMILAMFFPINKYVILLASTAFPISVFLLMFNVVFKEGNNGELTDGGYLKMLREKTPKSKLLIRIILLQNQYALGIRPRDVDCIIYENLPEISTTDPLFFVLYSNLLPIFLDKEDFENAKNMTMEVERQLSHCPEIHLSMIKADIMFVKIYIEKDKEGAKELFDEIEKELDVTPDISAIRCKIAMYALAFGDEEKLANLLLLAKSIKGTNHFPGNEKLEWDLIEKIITINKV